MVIKNKKTSTRQEVIITTAIGAITTSIIIVISNTQLQQEIRKESLAAAGIQPDNTEELGVRKDTESASQTFWINTVRLDGNANINGDPKLMYPPEKFPNSSLHIGGGFVLTPPDNIGDWSTRSFT